MDAVDSVVDPLREFAKDSVRLVKRCHKPDRKEFTKVAVRTAIGFVVMGFVGFFVKLIFIPINNIIVGSVILKNERKGVFPPLKRRRAQRRTSKFEKVKMDGNDPATI
ncbi:Protein transport protein Sec61 subunit gamma, partial [Cucurbita argyrosperma subsp. argyrosperma]